MPKYERKTRETEISATLELYGSGEFEIETGIGFFDHMLEALARHSLCNLGLKCEGDLHVDMHHSVEDTGIVLGRLFRKAVYPAEGIERFGNAVVVMDEACVSCDIDLSNRPYLYFDLPLEGKIGDFDAELVEEFFRAFAFNMPLTIHLEYRRGSNRHHIAEAAFKALALALRRALGRNERVGVPSTKGIL
jgi:imidazoleglycerol-phosphate dehydratase